MILLLETDNQQAESTTMSPKEQQQPCHDKEEEIHNISSGSSCSSGEELSSTTAMCGSLAGRQRGHTLKHQRKRKSKKSKSSKKRSVPVKTVCAVHHKEQSKSKRRAKRKKPTSTRTPRDQWQLAGSVLGISIGMGVLVWQHYEVFQVVGPSLAVIVGVALAAAVLIYVQDVVDSKLPSAMAPSLIPLPGGIITPSDHYPFHKPEPTPLKHNNTTTKRSSVSPSSALSKILDQKKTLSTTLNIIVERHLEDEYDYWWNELDSQTQYYALILGYTQYTWDNDFELEDLLCEEWDWVDMTDEQKDAAVHFGYTQTEWDCDEGKEHTIQRKSSASKLMKVMPGRIEEEKD